VNNKEAKRRINFRPPMNDRYHPLLRNYGYYYIPQEQGFKNPIIFSEDGEFSSYFFINVFKFGDEKRPFGNRANASGYFCIQKDTVIAKYAIRYDLGCFNLFEDYFMIKDSTTIELFRRNIL
jgi:hypothetical protein